MSSLWPRIEPLLAKVQKPARYIGCEDGAQTPVHGAGKVAWLLIYPDAYEIGLPNQGLQILYEILNERDDAVAERAYAPYSRYLVGAAVRARDGRVFEGVNVENAAYPLGVCAEKSAIVQAVAAGCRPGDLEAIGITASPCGGCRQWLHEFRIGTVSYRGDDGEIRTTTPAKLLPDTWNLPG